MNGPFFCERMLLGLPLHNELIGSFVVSCFVAQCRLTPRSHRMITLHTAFASTMRMIDRVHYHATHGWANSHVARARSEEHTSELQSQSNLVCRLLLEKKKNTSSCENMS